MLIEVDKKDLNPTEIEMAKQLDGEEAVFTNEIDKWIEALDLVVANLQ